MPARAGYGRSLAATSTGTVASLAHASAGAAFDCAACACGRGAASLAMHATDVQCHGHGQWLHMYT